jgi:hypothetical protein
MAAKPRGFDCDCQPQGGRELGMDRMVKISESLYTRRYRRNSARGCYAVTKMVRGRNAGCSILHRGHLGPPASRRDLTDLVIGPERGKPDLLRSMRKADRKECRREAG